MTTPTELRHATHLAKQFGKLRSFALEALLHAAMSSMEDAPDAATGHTLAQNVDALRDLLHVIRKGDEDKDLDGAVFTELLERDDVDGGVVVDAERLLSRLETLRDRANGGISPASAELEELFDQYTELRLRTSGFLRQVEQLADEWAASVEKSSTMRKQMSNTIEELERMSGAINILAINASVEASRAGSSGAAFRVIANEMQRLSQQSTGMLRTTRSSLGI